MRMEYEKDSINIMAPFGTTGAHMPGQHCYTIPDEFRAFQERLLPTNWKKPMHSKSYLREYFGALKVRSFTFQGS